VGRVTIIGEKKNSYKVAVGNLEETYPQRCLDKVYRKLNPTL
jgi:hypothetical protein